MCKRIFGFILSVAAWTNVVWSTETDEVPAPWTAVHVQHTPTGTEVGVWGRAYRFSRSALPASIETAKKEILAAPVRLTGEADGQPIAWKEGGHWPLGDATAEQATVCAWQASETLIVNTSTRIEYDGMMRIGLTVMPQNKKRPKLGNLWLEVPLKRELTTLYHYYPGHWGDTANSDMLPEQGLALPFKAFVWLGNEDGGLGWFAESDQQWRPASADRAIEVVPRDDALILRVHLLDSEAPLPATFTFGLQATPVKPWRKDFNQSRIWHAAELGVGITLQTPKTWWTCHRAFPDREPLRKLDRAQALGVKTVVFHEDWTPIQNYPVAEPEESFKAIVDACHRRGMKVLVYQGYELSPFAPEWCELHDDVLAKDTEGRYGSWQWYRPPAQRDYRVCYNSVWRDRLADKIEWALNRYGVDGLYLDSTVSPQGCCNERHGCGYRASDGTLHPTYPIFAVRALMQRLYRVVHARGGIISAHQSTCCVTPTLAFADCYWDGEQLTGNPNPLASVSLASFRTEFMGRNYGVPCEFLAYERPPQWTFDHALSVAMLHDVLVRPCGLDTLEKMSPIWDLLARFGTDNAVWHPYWEPHPLVTAEAESVKISFYARNASFLRNARLLLVVSNLAAKPVTAAVTVNRARLDVKARTAFDGLTREHLSFSDEHLFVPLEPNRMRFVWIE